MLLLGISAYKSKSSCVLFKDNELLIALSEESFTHIKDDKNFPIRALKEILTQYDLGINDIDLVCYSDDPKRKLEEALVEADQNNLQSVSLLKREYSLLEKLFREHLCYAGEISFISFQDSLEGCALFESSQDKEDSDKKYENNVSIGACVMAMHKRTGAIMTKPNSYPFVGIGSKSQVCLGDLERYLRSFDGEKLKKALNEGKVCAYIAGKSSVLSENFDNRFVFSKSDKDQKNSLRTIDMKIPSPLVQVLKNIPDLTFRKFVLSEGVMVINSVQAIDAFIRSDIDILLLEDKMLYRDQLPIHFINLYKEIVWTKKRVV